ncbi:MAG: hypothetical protein PHP26_04810 [Syntrophomonas sp.]|uniref:hypothetical protein n=1 Tax=Syntrophomonas sp. TaxID=2053627 RepID=UPI00262F538F|nr:hypothetical protein [Syntrophomonas sp.]MDD2509685.1 hypothetical protein [Syntrophomonas sp.]MDD3879297.1 hypothetical protein [Syntrophomonas sp.]MDD4625817.1 hypothetical protein [Syntrophomonas sp.]
MNELLKTLYKDILQQVMVLESCKKELSIQILLTRDLTGRLDLILRFLGYDLDKHELLEHAAVLAISNQEESIVEDLEKLYAYIEGNDLIQKIRDEIKFMQRFIKTINKAIKHPNLRTFYERRMVQEISKYVLEQARLYSAI